MNKKNMAKKTAALFLGLALTAGGVGCNNFILTDSEKDLNQTVATVDISATLANDKESGYAEVANDVKTIVNDLSSDISKRDLVAYFLSTGYQYVESYGYTYKDTFNMLMDGLISREIMIQYAIAYYLKNTDLNAAGCEDYVEAELKKVNSDTQRKLLEENKEVLTLKYFLTENGEKEEEFDRAVYSLKKSLNDSLDSLESGYIKAESEEHNHSEARTLPTGVNTEKEDYYDTKYEVYTGRNVVGEENSYERVDGSTTSTRQKAYNAFLANLQGYNLVGTNENEDPSDIKNLSYYYIELSSILGQALLNKYYESLEDSITQALTEDYVRGKYNELVKTQEQKYASSPADFATAMDSVSDTSPMVYGLDGFGYVYNILLPFSKSQEIEYTRAKNNKTYSQNDLYNIRKEILTKVEGEDQRSSWISEHDHASYATEKDGKYYFFQDNFGDTKYENLKQYAGSYAFNGTVDKSDEKEWKITPNKIGIDEFIKTLESQINLAVGKSVAAKDTAWISTYNSTDYMKADSKTEVDNYGKFMYYTGKTDFGTATAEELRKNYFNEESDIYKAVSAVNELMFAYSTDTGCLNKYFGYAVSPYSTQFVKEFEYAAQYVVDQGMGSYAVCATDYGWHILYASFVYDGKDVYGEYVKDQAEGTFSEMFYESLKDAEIVNYSTDEEKRVLNTYNNSASVTRFEKRYQDLLDMDNN